jgi:hypothetical protein
LTKDETMDIVQKRNNCTNLPSSQTFRSYLQSVWSSNFEPIQITEIILFDHPLFHEIHEHSAANRFKMLSGLIPMLNASLSSTHSLQILLPDGL